MGNRQVIILLRAESWDTVKVRYLKHLEYVVMNFGHFQQGCALNGKLDADHKYKNRFFEGGYRYGKL